MATVEIESIDRLFANFRVQWQAHTDALTAWWRALQPGLLALGRHVEAIDQARRARRRTMHTAYSRRLRARRRRNR